MSWWCRRRAPAALLVLVALPGVVAGEQGRDGEAWSLSLEDAVLSALEHNPALQAEQLEPLVAGTFEQLERAEFEPRLGLDALYGREREQRLGELGEDGAVRDEYADLLGSVRQRFATGTELELSLGQRFLERVAEEEREQHTTRIGATLTQQLLEGRGREVNLVALRQAELATLGSEYELAGFAAQLVADVEVAYWEYVLADREIAIFEQSLSLAEQEVERAQERVRLGDLAETELAPLEAEVALRRQELIDARNRRESARLELLRLAGSEEQVDEDRAIEPQTEPERTVREPDPVTEHLALALQHRPEINQARLELQGENLEVTRTRNGLLPRLELFVSLGRSGYADSFSRAPRELDGSSYDAELGIRLERPLRNRAPEAEHRRALAERNQANLSLSNLARLIRHDVRTAHLELQRAAAQIEASAATRRAQQERVRAEDERFRAGDATAFAVVQAQRDLLEAQINEAAAVVEYRTALVELYRLDGTLLQRRGIEAVPEQANLR